MSKMFYTMKEAEVALGLHDDEIQILIAAGKLREFRDGPRLMFKTDQVDALVAELKEDDEFEGHNITEEDVEGDEDIEMGAMDDDALKNFIANHAMTKLKAEAPKPAEAVEPIAAIRPFGERKPTITVQSSRTSVPENTEVAVAPRKIFSAIKTVSNGAGNSAVDPDAEIRELLKEMKGSVDTLNRAIRSAKAKGFTVSVTENPVQMSYDHVDLKLYKQIYYVL